MSHDVMDADAIDVLRLKAFKTNKPADRDAYSNAVSRWFQDRHARDMAAEIEVAKLVSEAEARGMERAAPTDPASAFNRADWFWRAMDPDDCGDSPEEAINRAMVGCFCVCEIASSYAGPTRYGFIAPVLDPESDDEEFVHFATQQEAIDEAKRRADTAAIRSEATK